ncbi:transposable element Tc3 transposase [Trichonephila clavipes]|nr:transposable element Tc3 transposase [Trichonephila clavipes]
MITNVFIPKLNNQDVQELWFQQDGATCHTARATIDLLKDTFGDHLISRFGPVNWPPRSCDLTPLDYFLWGYVKSLVYPDKPQTLDHLEDNIRRVIADIRPQMLEKSKIGRPDCTTSEPADKLQGGGDIKKIQTCIPTHGRKRLRSALGGIVHKKIEGNKPVLPQSFKLSSPAEQQDMFYEHRAGRYTPDLRNGRRKCKSSRKIVSRNVCTERRTEKPNVTMHHYENEYASLRDNIHCEGGTRVTRTHSMIQL